MGVLIINNNMKLSLWLLFLALFVWSCEAAKGGAKSVINRKRQRGPGNSYNTHNRDDGAEAGIGGAFTGGGTLGLEPGSGPCVGVCYYVKKRGLTVGKQIMEKLKKRKPCIGLCFLKKKKGKKAAEKIE